MNESALTGLFQSNPKVHQRNAIILNSSQNDLDRVKRTPFAYQIVMVMSIKLI